ncbi:MAG TPA: hypothetical protein PLL64_10770 [Rhodothermales bacterium]|nr:hypothetical protein [Rhodothermales bacterium]
MKTFYTGVDRHRAGMMGEAQDFEPWGVSCRGAATTRAWRRRRRSLRHRRRRGGQGVRCRNQA